jgi:hypothetical protein
MAKQVINIGTTANDGTGDPLRSAFDKVNDNFTELYTDDAGDVNSVNAGTGISVNSTTGAVTVTNSAPDQTVALTGGTQISTSGTYPNFTITNDAPNATHTGEVTGSAGSAALTIANDVISYAKLGAEFTTTGAVTTALDFGANQVFTKTMSGDTTFTYSNVGIGMVKDFILTGSHTPTFPSGTKTVAGTYDGSVSNLIQILAVASGDYWMSISKAQ